MKPGDLISGKYRLHRQLGTGGMGSVWAARNEMTERDFAMKFLLPSLSKNKDALHRFFLEARACGRIKHRAVVEVYDVGTAEDGSPYLVMELLEGEGLDMRLEREGSLPVDEAARLLGFVARGLEEAHVRGVVHRDLKPGNIFLSLDGAGEVVPKILDFGVSKATGPRSDSFAKTMTGAVLGSPAYMSPEQARGETELDGRSDVWALGLILYEALTGDLPFNAPNYNALMVQILNKPHRPIREIAPGVPPELEALVDRALVKDREVRISTARELAEGLEAVVAALPPSVVHTGAGPITMTGASARAARAAAITQETWAEGRRSAGRARANVVRIALVCAATLLAGGAGTLLHLARPPTALAAHASHLLVATIARCEARAIELRAQLAAEERARAEQTALEVQMAIDEAEKEEAEKEAARKARWRGRVTKDPHGGVEGPGF